MKINDEAYDAGKQWAAQCNRNENENVLVGIKIEIVFNRIGYVIKRWFTRCLCWRSSRCLCWRSSSSSCCCWKSASTQIAVANFISHESNLTHDITFFVVLVVFTKISPCLRTRGTTVTWLCYRMRAREGTTYRNMNWYLTVYTDKRFARIFRVFKFVSVFYNCSIRKSAVFSAKRITASCC